ncbi:MAG: hypothetical protein ACOYKQ_11725, partial [Polymorphobacter sp.]
MACTTSLNLKINNIQSLFGREWSMNVALRAGLAMATAGIGAFPFALGAFPFQLAAPRTFLFPP